MMSERRLKVDHTTIYRWVNVHGSELKKKLKTFVKESNDPWKVDELFGATSHKCTTLLRAS